MKKFALKLFIFSALLILFVIFYLESMSFLFKNDIFDNELETKILTLIVNNKDDVNLIVAGDSRAERQVIPEIIEKETGLKAVNIGTPSCDLITLYNALNKYNLLGQNKTFIISASIFQVNDGATDYGYISPSLILNMSTWEKLVFFLKKPSIYTNMTLKIGFHYAEKFFVKKNNFDENYLKKGGVLEIEESAKLPISISLDPQKTQHPWYKNIEITKTKWRIFKETLKKLSESGDKIIIYQPPIMPSWQEYTKDTFIDNAEKKYSQMLSEETKKYKNILFLDFYNNKNEMLTNEMYADIQHLNKEGTKIFTQLLIKEIIKIK